VTLPGRPVAPGHLHLSTRTLRRIREIFAEMGFQVYEAPEVETDENNFELLNIHAISKLVEPSAGPDREPSNL